MCGRFIFVPTEEEKDFFDSFNIETPIDVESSYNVAPSQLTPVVTKNSPNQASYMSWGLIPRWSKTDKFASKLINARIETITEKPSFRHLVNSSRCLIPASGYYEWSDFSGEKVPYLIKQVKPGMLALGGLYDEWESPEGETIATFTIITRSAQKDIDHLHDRMPLIIKRDLWEKWLDKGIPFDRMVNSVLEDHQLEYYQVDKKVNNPGNNSPSLIEPLN